jgi:hypothetical protein
LFPGDHLARWIFVLVQRWYKKAIMSKKKVFAARNLKDCLPSLPLKRRKAKKTSKIFHHDNAVAISI